MPTATIVQKGKSDWSVVSPSLQQPGFDFAVAELRKYMRQITGIELPLGKDAAASRSVVIGLRSDLAPELAAALPKAAKGYDGYSVAVTANRVIIAGDNNRGAIYGVYDLLEQIGCRFFYPVHDAKDPEVVPSKDTVKIDVGKWSVASPIPYRVYNGSAWFFDIDPKLANEQTDIAMKCRYNCMGWQCAQDSPPLNQYHDLVEKGVIGEVRKRGMMFHGPGHSFNLFLSNDYMKDHPDWFGFRDGERKPQVFGGSQYCWSNAEARSKMIDNVEKFVLGVPEMAIICTLGFDGGRSCECPECAKSTPADLVVTMMNELIARLAKSAPHVRVEMSGGYAPVHEPPTKAIAHPDLRVVWAHWGRNHEMGYDDPRYGWKENLNTWRTFVSNHLTLCQYYADNFASPWVAAPYTIAMEGDRRFVLQHGIDGWYMLIYPKGYWWNHGINAWLGGIAFYDVSVDFYERIRDYAMHYFGPKAGPLLAAYYEQWAREIRLPYRVKDFATDYDRAVFAAQRKAWIDPAVKAVKNDSVLSYRVGKVEKLHQWAERSSEMWRLREEIQKLRGEGKFKKALEKVEEARKYTQDLLAWLYELADLNQGLVDRNEIPGFLGMKVKDWVEEEAKAIEEGTRQVGKDEMKELDSMEVLPSAVTGGGEA